MFLNKVGLNLFLILSLICFRSRLIDANPYKSLGNVVHLKGSTFDDFITNNPNVLVIFYAPWCGHCKSLVPILDPVAAEVEEFGGKGKIGVIDATVEVELTQRFDIKGYPTLFFFSGDPTSPSTYPESMDSRSKDVMVKLLLSRDKDLYSLLDTRSYSSFEDAKLELKLNEKVEESKSTVIVYYGKPNTVRTKAVIGALETLRDEGFEVVSYLVYVNKKADIGLHIYALPDKEEPDSSQAFNPKRHIETPSIILGRSEWNHQILKLFIETAARPLISFNGISPMYIHESSNSLIAYLPENVSEAKKLREELLEYAEKYFNPHDPHLDIAVGFLPRKNSLELEESVGYSLNHPMVKENSFLLKLRSGSFEAQSKRLIAEKYLIPGPVTSSKMYEVMNKIKENNYPRFYKSMNLEETSMATDIEVAHSSPFLPLEIVANTFDKYVKSALDHEALFIMFYAPWCGHCKSLKPIWLKLAQKVHKMFADKGRSRVTIAMYDVTKNDLLHGIDVQGIPTLFFFPFGSDKIINKSKYEGSREIEGLMEYVQDQYEDYLDNVRNKEKSHARDEL
ncbi:thioredoxin family protein [Cryptosporidium serpentis]